MMIIDLIEKIPYLEIINNGVFLESEISKVYQDSRIVEENSIYVAIIGEVSNGHKFIDSAINKGAKIIVHSEDIDIKNENVIYVKVEDTRKALGTIAKELYLPNQKIKVIGVTGTNGKTTSAFMVKNILESAGKKVGLIGTIANYIGNEKIGTERTTPATIELYKLLNKMEEENCEYCVMEVSSHGSALDRAYGLKYTYSIYTNLTQDHLDFHKDMMDYFNAKFKFLGSADKINFNIDDNYGEIIKNRLDEKNKNDYTTYGINNGDVKAVNIISNSNYSLFDLSISGEIVCNIKLNMIGLYNIYNALGVISVLKDILTVEEIKYGFENMMSVEGRCEEISHKNLESTVIVDYAHTPDGVENILKSIRNTIDNSKIITVIGCGGNRDKTKRPIMGEIASRYSDSVVVTSDNPRFEEPKAIIEDITSGIEKDNFVSIVDRKEAIEYALSISRKSDIVVILGKGHEDYQIIKDEKIHFSDRETVLNYAKKM